MSPATRAHPSPPGMTEHRVDQTILHGDQQRPGNCFAACVATATGKALHEVPHFVEWGQYLHNGQLRDDQNPDRECWWAMFIGWTMALGLHPVALRSVHDADPDELVFVSGLSVRGVMHQVLYRNAKLWHDPHPSREGILSIDPDDLIYVLRPLSPAGHDHEPTIGGDPA